MQHEAAVRWVLDERPFSGVCRAKAAFSQWVRIPPGDFAPAGSNRSSYGGNEIAEAFDAMGDFG